MERFWSKVELIPFHDCWEWTGAKDHEGYGRFHYLGRTWKAPRLAFKIAYKKIPENSIVCHRCDNPSCVNPVHLFLGDHKINSWDCTDKGRHPQANKAHCKWGHPYDEKNTRVIRGRWRACRMCAAIGKSRSLQIRRMEGKACHQTAETNKK